MFFGIVIVLIGVIMLLEHFGVLTGNVWGIFWPIVIILIGLSFFKGKGCFTKKDKE